MPKRWNFLSNHGLVILHIVQNTQATLREIALSTGLTERAVYQIVRELEEGKFISKRKVGRRNAYTLNERAILNYPAYSQATIADVGRIISGTAQPD
ncbi:MAG: winged helix-turn-helix domain-containing protein [Dehalococcoidia bacterium]|jgi:DNA-binding IclR family transcriptional regulator|nr:winged helix-turn-helix domain-containing protein [Dehalococcoidia bacterium]